MSVIVIAKDGESLALGTDSRVMKHDFSAPLMDTERKVFEIAPGTFIATAGWLMPCHFQVETACQLAQGLNTTDVQVLAEALERESLSYLEKFIELLASAQNLPQVDQVLSGERVLHICALAGHTASGQLGYCIQTFRVRNGQVLLFREEYFGTQRQMFCSCGDFNELLLKDLSIWTVSPVQVVQNFLSTLKLASPFIGGPDQIVALDNRGVHWASPAPIPTVAPAGLTVQTAFFAGTATFAYTATGPYVQVGSAGAVFGDSYPVPQNSVTINSSGVTVARGANSVQVTAAGVGIYGPNGSVVASSSGVAINNGSFSTTSGSVTVNIDGVNYVKVSDTSSQYAVGQMTNLQIGYTSTVTPNCQSVLGLTGSRGAPSYGHVLLGDSAGNTVKFTGNGSANPGTVPASCSARVSVVVNGTTYTMVLYGAF